MEKRIGIEKGTKLPKGLTRNKDKEVLELLSDKEWMTTIQVAKKGIAKNVYLSREPYYRILEKQYKLGNVQKQTIEGTIRNVAILWKLK